jgi:hypothetical protein
LGVHPPKRHGGIGSESIPIRKETYGGSLNGTVLRSRRVSGCARTSPI